MNTIDVETLRRWLETGQPVIILDVRTAADYTQWAIPGSLHVDAYADLKAQHAHSLDGVSLPADVPVVTVCNAGFASQVAAEQLQARGIAARSLEGGMRAWSLAWNTADISLPGSTAQVVQIRRVGKGCLSYLIGSGEEAAVVDAALEPEVYLNLAQSHGWQITTVLDTHIHADHLSRSCALAERSHAPLYLLKQERVAYPFTPLDEGATLKIGTACLTALRTPGHTLESTCYLLDQQVLFSGDTLFLQGVGRPDLHADPAESRVRAHLLYQSLQRLRALPGQILLLPGHTSSPTPFDQKPLTAHLAEVWEDVKLLHLAESDFIETLLARVPPLPSNHQRITELNEAGFLPENPIELEAGANRCAIV
jgi:glyoxylase-like metal-dependent hydrolase (beta-lactamase superfamily II)/rhodanese-related sulfurtransferase